MSTAEPIRMRVALAVVMLGMGAGSVIAADPKPSAKSTPAATQPSAENAEQIRLVAGASDRTVHGEAAAEAEQAISDRVKLVKEGTSSRAARKEALDRLPVDKFKREHKHLASGVLDHLSMFRELPTVSFETNPAVYRFFAACPDVAVSIWRVLEVSDFKMYQTAADGYEAEASDGSSGIVDVLLRSDDQNVIYCEGMYKSPFLVKPIKAKAILHLESRFVEDAARNVSVTHRASLFVSFPSATVETAAKVISPVSNAIVDRNFREVSLFVHMMSKAMERQPGWVERVAERMDGVLECRKGELVNLTAQAYGQAAQLEAQRAASGGAARTASGEAPTTIER